MELSKMLQQLTGGMLITTEIFILTLLFSLPLGLVLSFGRMSKVGVIRFLTKVYISIMRGTPLMLQLIVVYFAPYYVFGLKISQGYRMVAVILAFVLNYAAYFAEIYRSGIESMPVGQYEAAKMLGYSKAQTFLKIILPQVIKRVLPAVTNEMITLVKDTSLIYVLAMNDLLRTTRNLVQRDFSITPFLVAGVFYLLMTLVLTYGFDKLDLSGYTYEYSHFYMGQTRRQGLGSTGNRTQREILLVYVRTG